VEHFERKRLAKVMAALHRRTAAAGGDAGRLSETAILITGVGRRPLFINDPSNLTQIASVETRQ
jgi:hypothetical protein